MACEMGCPDVVQMDYCFRSMVIYLRYQKKEPFLDLGAPLWNAQVVMPDFATGKLGCKCQEGPGWNLVNQPGNFDAL